MNENQGRPGFQIKTLELCFGTESRKKLSTVREERGFPGKKDQALKTRPLPLPDPNSPRRCGDPPSHLIILKSEFAKSHESLLKKPGESEANRKRKSCRWRARNMKGRSYNRILSNACALVNAEQLENVHFRMGTSEMNTDVEVSHQIRVSQKGRKFSGLPLPPWSRLCSFHL